MTTIADAYIAEIAERLTALRQSQADAIANACEAVVEAAGNDGLVYVFGTGHSHMLSEEVHFRAGGLALTVPILAGPTMLHEGAEAGMRYERMEGVVSPIFERYDIQARDVLVVASNSGVNAAPMEAARIGKEKGATVIAITSLAYSSEIAKGRERLADVADIVLDNQCPPGDAVMAVPGSELRVGPASTAIGVTLLNAVMAEAAGRLSQKGDAPIYLSGNMPGAAKNNEGLVARYRPRNRHL